MSEVGAGGDEEDIDDAAGSGAGPRKQDIKLPALKLRTFTGERKDYEEWRRELRAMELLYAIPPTHMAMLVYLALESGAGRPRDLVSHIEVEALATAKGYDEMMGVLDDEYIREDYVKAGDVSKVYERMRRDAGTTMKDYLLNLRCAKRMLEKEDKGTTISDISCARHMLRRSRLSTIEQRQVLGACGAVWNSAKIESSLQLMFMDAHKDD